MSSPTTLIYGGGPFYTGGSTVIADLQNSGFTTVVAWGIWIRSTSGDLYYNDTLIVQDGKYVGDSNWNATLASLKQGATSVNRILLSILGPFANIKALGTQKNGILYNNFQALLQAVPALDGIDFDNEDLYDDTTVDFALMLQSIGYSQVTFCPYERPATWAGWMATIDSQASGFVTGFNLQCYSGGSPNQDQIPDWIAAIQASMGSGFDAKGFVFPGLWCIHDTGGVKCSDGDCPASVTSKFKGWQSNGLQGGWIYLYDSIQECSSSGFCGQGAAMDTAAYASAIVQGLANGGS